MKSAPFDYHAPVSVEEAVALLAEHGEEATVLAGGQSLIPLLAMRLARPGVLVDIGRCEGLAGVTADGALRVGAATSQRAAERSPDVAGAAPLLARALPFIGHPAIRNRGTIGGSLCHADPAAELPAVAAALDAELVVRGPAGQRSIPAREFFLGYLTTAAAEGELLIEVRFPPLAAGSGTSFLEVSRRHGDFALVGCAATVTIAAGTVTGARIAFAGVDATPVRATAAEEALVGQPAGEETWAAAAGAAVADLEPGADLHATGAYRRHVARALARRALAEAAAGAAA